MKFTKLSSIFLIISLILIILPTQTVHAATGPICYVKTGASGAGNSWADAYPDLQTALADSNCSEIWVAQGTYYPDEGTGQTNNDRSSSFTLINNVAIYGGFDGTETLRTERDWKSNTTTLSGDIDQLSGDSGNAYHVLIGSSTDNTAILDGFTITDGTAEGTGPSDTNGLGGGMYNNNGSPTLTNLVFSKNSAKNYHGGGLYSTGSTPAITNVTFDNNTAAFNGGGAYIHFSSVSNIINTTFSNNTAGYEGGGAFLFFSNPVLENVTFSGNTASGGTGHDDSAGHRGGGLFNGLSSAPQLTNVTFYDNSAEEEGGAIFNEFGNPTLKNVILWGNTAPTGPEMENFFATPVITNSVIQGSNGSGSSWDTNLGTDNGGNLDADPKLGTLADNGGDTQTHALLSGSSAIDNGTNAGCPATDQRGIPRPQGAGCDIGAYEAGTFKVTSTTPTSGTTLSSLSSIDINYSEDALHDSTNKAANNTDNYILVEAGPNSSFDTLSCAGGVKTDDIEQNIIGAAYANNGGSGPFTTTLTLANPLTDGKYRLYICGTTSIWSAAGIELNDGLSDSTVNFTIGTVAASSLPETGFRHGEVTQLPKQPATKAYADTAMTLEISKLGVSMPIVGVPKSNDSWDVTWLGNSAGWLNGSAFPTWAGNTVLTGHVWDAYNQPGPFAELKTLQYGDQFQIQAWGQTYTYEVRESKVYWARIASSKVFQHKEYDWVTLLTCEAYNPFTGTYFFRRAVHAVLVSVK